MSFIRRILDWFATPLPTLRDLGSQREQLGLPETSINNIHIKHVSSLRPVRVSTESEVDSAEAALGTSFPRYYREYVCRFGYGCLGGTLVRIATPEKIVASLPEFRERITEYWFWETGHQALPKHKVLETIQIGDTVQGDDIIFHPDEPSKLFCLARGGPNIYYIGPDLFEAIDWLCSAGIITRPFKMRNFEPC